MASPARSTSPRRVIVLGSTGSIGVNVMHAIAHLHAKTDRRFEVVGLATGSSADVAAEQATRFGVRHVAIANGGGGALRDSAHIYRGCDAAAALIDAVAEPGDLVVAAMVGFAGLPAVVRAIEKRCDIALANKETLVAAGSIVMPLARANGVHIIPIDSEHSAVFQCLQCGRSIDEVRRIVLTASGGPFRKASTAEVRNATVEQALNHPTWNMGAKVTIDSATLMNKALEVIEAHHLFGVGADRIGAIIHPQSIIHSFVEFIDGSVIAHLSPPDMKLPIQYALTWPERVEGCARRIDWETFAGLEFQPIDSARFPAIEMALDVVCAGGTSGAVFNAANEVAVQAFLDRRIGFPRIFEIVRETMDEAPPGGAHSLDEIFEADRSARDIASRWVSLTNAEAAAVR